MAEGAESLAFGLPLAVSEIQADYERDEADENP